MKKKSLLLVICLLLLSNYIYKTIWYIKYSRRIYNNIVPSEEAKNNITNKGLSGEVLENNFTDIIINKGYRQNIKINMICEGEKGFIGLVSEVFEDYSIVKTFWYINWKLIVIDGNNNYGYLNSNGYFIFVYTSKSSESSFEDHKEVYIISNEKKSLVGRIKHFKRNIYKLAPEENILKIKKVYVK